MNLQQLKINKKIIGNKAIMNKVKVKIIQGIIQIDPPINWTINNINRIANEIKTIETYNEKKKVSK
jgi:hypothetical protein